MSKTTEFLIPPTMQLTPKHVDAMHLVKLFVKEFEKYKLDPADEERACNNHCRRMRMVHETCKNFGF